MELDVIGNKVIQSIRVGIVGGSGNMQWSLGGRIKVKSKEYIISDIVRDDSAFEKYGDKVYIVYGKYDGETKMLKYYENQPVSLMIKA